MNKRTDCQLWTICHHWQPIKQTNLISLLFTLFAVFTLISASYHPTQQHLPLQRYLLFYASCESTVGIIPKEIITCRLVLPYEQQLSADGQQVCLTGLSHVDCVECVMGGILLPTQNTHFSDVPDLMRGNGETVCCGISMREDMF